MELSLSMWSVHRTVREKGWTVLDFLSFCKDEGIRQVELLDVFWKDAERELPQAVAFAAEHGIKVSSYAVGNDLVKASEEERARELQVITNAFPIAKALGTSTIRVFSGNLSAIATFDEALDWIVDGLGSAARKAEAEGLVLCLENHGQLAGSGKQVQTIIDRVNSPSLRSTFDTGNFLLVDENPSAALDILLPYIAHVHLKDFAQRDDGRYKSLGGKAFEGANLGFGDVEVKAILDRLANNGYQGAIVLEYEGVGSEAEGIRRSYEYFNQTIA
ncbi:sugar phosphate isomerase/epimerase family protein [Paenibacillus soyae]|uniref:Sugar phosphate isomerase/epimerase n=1 Tax=Paenibacillus soyae TaxID=2969249 RepID=A0A9X2MWC2_9BACL|nr:sugar phosphate isomerase/epimerase family protein [Paenibacillus soyae]MCR2807527.1 sugar phosphate isomerase/epimerase [Paenibacillus soyae]